MFRNIIISFILLTAVLASGRAYCQEMMNNQRINTIAGKVIDIDHDSGFINIRTDNGNVQLNILVTSELLRRTHHMASIEIEYGDPVIVKYDSSSGRNIVI